MKGWKWLTLSALIAGAVGCSVVPDHANDYQTSQEDTRFEQEQNRQSEINDKLTIPNSNAVPALTEKSDFETPTPPLVFHPIVLMQQSSDSSQFTLHSPVSIAVTRNAVKNFLASLYGEGNPVREEDSNRMESAPLDFKKRGTLARWWSNITRLYPEQAVFEFRFSEENGGGTRLDLRFRKEKQGEEPGPWLAPEQSEYAQSVAVRLWGTLGRQFYEASAYLSEQDRSKKVAVWVDHQGRFVVNAKSLGNSDVEGLLMSSNLYFTSKSPLKVAFVPEDEVAKVGDLIDLVVPEGTFATQDITLFKVRRRHLDDVAWDEREYPLQILSKKSGLFLVMDTSASEYPELTSFRFMSRLLADKKFPLTTSLETQ